MNAVDRLAGVVSLPNTWGARRTTGSEGPAQVPVRDPGPVGVDDWGRDATAVEWARVIGQLRRTVTVGGVDHLPRRAGALVVVNTRRFALIPVITALAISDEIDRPVRFVGRPDVAPVGPLFQRLGGLLPLEAEIDVALRSGAVVVLGAGPGGRSRCGTVDHRLVGAAVAAGVRVVPTAAVSGRLVRSTRIEIGRPVRLRRIRRGPLAELELADLLRDRVDGMIEGLIDTSPFDVLALRRAAVAVARGH